MTSPTRGLTGRAAALAGVCLVCAAAGIAAGAGGFSAASQPAGAAAPALADPIDLALAGPAAAPPLEAALARPLFTPSRRAYVPPPPPPPAAPIAAAPRPRPRAAPTPPDLVVGGIAIAPHRQAVLLRPDDDEAGAWVALGEAVPDEDWTVVAIARDHVVLGLEEAQVVIDAPWRLQSSRKTAP
jgi:hypothetical protein